MKIRIIAAFTAFVFAFASLVTGADVVSVWGGARGTIILKSDGTVWTWGANFAGKLGVGQDTSTLVRVSTPVEVHGAGNTGFLNSVSTIMGGEVHNLALKSDGTLWAWGSNAFGQLGNGTTNDASTPVQTGLLSSPPLANLTKLGGRPYFSLAVKSDGSIWAWGWNRYGQMGNGTSGNTNLIPTLVSNSAPGGAINNPVQVTCCYQAGAALTTNGTVWTWGGGSHGELGNGTTNVYFPAQVPGLSNITQISAGWFHILARKSDGTAWAWGNNTSGELGDGTTNNQPSPVQVLNLTNVIAVTGGDGHSSALLADGTVWKWGKNDVGELGLNSADTNAHPLAAKILTDKFGAPFSNVVMHSARDYHNIAVKADGSVWMWGADDQGQCGDGFLNSSGDLRPTPVTGLGARVALPLSQTPDVQPGNMDLSWTCNTGEFYAIEYTTNLMNGFTSVLQSNILSTPPATTVIVPMTNSPGFYRLRF